MKKLIAIGMILLVLGAGCRKANTQTPAPAPTEPPAAEQPTAAPASTPGPEAEATEPGEPYAFSFTAQTLDGDTVTEAYLGAHDLTMVNVWASWCGPCRSELKELGQLYGKLPENVGFLSVTVDDPGDLADAKALLEENGCAFPCLDGQGSPGLMTGFLRKVSAIPTTLFFDSRGNQVGQWIVGVPRGSSVVDAYWNEIQARLDSLNGK